MRILPRKHKREEGMPSKLETEQPWYWIHHTSKGFGEFFEAGELQLDLAKLDEGEGIAETLLKHNASGHKSCRVKYNATKLKRLERKRKPAEGNVLQQPEESGKREDLTSLARL